jgi:hypothetical protein
MAGKRREENGLLHRVVRVEAHRQRLHRGLEGKPQRVQPGRVTGDGFAQRRYLGERGVTLEVLLLHPREGGVHHPVEASQMRRGVAQAWLARTLVFLAGIFQ